MAPSSAPLVGIRVVEFSNTIAGPSAGRLLADFGATVIKVEPPEGDHLRSWGDLAPDGTSWWFKSHNRNKTFLRCDLNDAAERALVMKLIAGSDVVLENYRPGQLGKWGFSYAQLSAALPRLVYVSISGYGQDGPYADRPGFGHIAESMSGFRYLTGFPDAPPVRTGLSIGDEIAALYAVIGTVMALRARDRDGRGDHVDVSLLESLFSLTEGLLPDFVHTGLVTERTGNRYARAAPSNIYMTRDKQYASIAANSDPMFKRLAEVMGQPALAADPRFTGNQARVANVEALDALVQAWAGSIDLEPLLDRLIKAGIPASGVYSIAHIAKDPQFQARGAIAAVPDEQGTPIATPGLVPKLKVHPGRLSHAAKAVDADRDAVKRMIED